MKRAIAIILAAGALGVVVAAVLGRNELFERLYVYQITRDEGCFDELLREGGEVRRRALKRYLRTAEGQRLIERKAEWLLALLRATALVDPQSVSGVKSLLDGSSRGSFAVLADIVAYVDDDQNSRGFFDFRGKALELDAFLELLDESLGRKFDVPDSLGLVVEIVTSQEAARRVGLSSFRISNVSADYVDTREQEYRALLSGAAQSRRRSQVQSGGKEAYREFGNHPALFYSRE